MTRHFLDLDRISAETLRGILDDARAVKDARAGRPRGALDDALTQSAPGPDPAALNRRLYLSERALTSGEGLPGRDWYRHQVYAPGFYTGYGVKTLPRVREAIEAELYDQVDAEIGFTARVLNGFADYLDATAALVAPPLSE